MRIAMKGLAGAALIVALAACGDAVQETPSGDAGSAAVPAAGATGTTAPAASVAVADAKPTAYAQCAACHAVEPGKHGIGPSLHGVYGTVAGELPGYAFSEKLKASGLKWDDATLDKWLEAPMKMVPGTKMSYAGLKDPAQRAEIIAYMKTLK